MDTNTALGLGSHHDDSKQTNSERILLNSKMDNFKQANPSKHHSSSNNNNNDTTILSSDPLDNVVAAEKISPPSSVLLLDNIDKLQQQQQLMHLRHKQQQILISRQLQQRHNSSNNSNNHYHHHHHHKHHYHQHNKPSTLFKFVDKTKSKLNWWRCVVCLSHKSHRFSNSTLVQICQDWLFLALLGIIMAILSFSMDSVITLFLRTRLWLYSDISGDNVCIQYLGWCTMPIILVAFSTGFVHVFSPAAVGSGIPEMKTILRGVILNEYLTFRTLIGKIVGLTFTLGSGLPLGKEGPFVHMASIVATLLSKLVASFQGIYENESRTSEMLSAACAVGVAATFYAPIGGVLFSIEITTVYFAVRNYWRGFFAACCGATIWRLLSFWIKNDESISAIFKTNFKPDFPFDPIELVAFSFIGATCGLAGAAYIKFHREIVQVFRRHRRLSEYLHNNRFVYPIVVTFIITSVTFPPFLGKYTASTLSTHDTIEQLFSNKTWSLVELDLETETMLNDWTTPKTGFHLHLVMYIVMKFWTSALASTIPIPSGLFIPVLKMGAAYGRLLGEIMAQLFPDGIHYGHYVHPAAIVPGSYAVVGAAAFSGAVTHTISTSVILFEMTGQIVHIIPVILAVLISNAVCQSLQPSIYDSIIEMKKLPYLPPIASSNSVSHKILVRDFMTQKIAYIWKDKCTYKDLKTVLRLHRRVNSFPLVQSSETKILLGSIPRVDLLKILYLKLNREQRLQEFRRRTSIENQNRQQMSSICSAVNQQPNQDGNQLRDSPSENGVVPNQLNATMDTTKDTDMHNGNEETQSKQQQSVIMMEKQISHKATTTTSCKEEDSSYHQYEKIDPLNLNRTSIARPINFYNKHSISEQDNEIVRKQLEMNIYSIQDDSAIYNNKKEAKREHFLIRMTTMSQSTESNSTSPSSEDDRASRNSSEDKVATSVSPEQETNATSSNLSLVVDLELALNKNNSNSNNIGHNDNNNNNNNNKKKDKQTVSVLSAVETRLSPTRSILKSGVTDYSDRLRDSKVQYSLEGTGHRRRLRSLTSRKDLNNSNSVEILRKKRSVRLPRLRVIDTTPEEQEEWEQEQLRSYVDFSKCQVDAAPFQLVEQTSLYRVHTLFSMLGLNHAYVTSVGRLVGIVALRDIRHAIEEMNTGEINFKKSINRTDLSLDRKVHVAQNGRSTHNNSTKVPEENHHTSTDEELYTKL